MESTSFEGDVIERVIPVENIQLMFHYKNPFVVHQLNNVTVKQPHSIVSGLNDTFSDVSTNGETGVVFVSFYPTGACNFFDFPLSEIENQSIDMQDVFGSEIRRIEEMLVCSRTLSEKVNIVENFLINRFSPIPQHDSLMIKKGLEIVKSRKGQIDAITLSECLSISSKTLERKFSQYLGKTTKQVIKLVRFNEVLMDISCNKKHSITEYAYKNGYFDQAHFIRDFKAYSGYTPKEFVAKYPDFSISIEDC